MSSLHDFPDPILMRADKLSDATTTLFLHLHSIHCKPIIIATNSTVYTDK